MNALTLWDSLSGAGVMGQNAAVSVVGGGDAASVIDEFLKQNAQGELLVGTGFASAFGLAWLHQRSHQRPVRLLIGDLRTGFDRWSNDDREAALAFLSREDVSVRGCHTPEGILHSKVWIALDPEDPGRPTGVLVGSANLTRQGLFKNDETVARAAPEELQRIRDELAQSMQRSWDAKGELMARLGRDATDVGALPQGRRRQGVGLASGWRKAAVSLVGAGVGVVALIVALLVGLPWLVNFIVDSSTNLVDTSQDEPEAVDSTVVAPAPAVTADTRVAETAPPTVVETAAVPVTSGPADDIAADTNPHATTQTLLPDPVCPYGLPDGNDACELLASLGGVDSTPCDSLPLAARPLRLSSDANPAGYQPAHDAPHLVCTWIDGGTYVAGETIHAGDLRAMNATVWGTGACQFEVYDEAGTVVASRADYENAGWTSHAMLRLKSGTTIRTDGCGWVPAEFAGLARAADGVVKAANHTGRSYPLIVGVDVPPGSLRIECDFWAWPNAEPNEHGSWADALPRREDDRRAAGPYRAESGIIWPKC